MNLKEPELAGFTKANIDSLRDEMSKYMKKFMLEVKPYVEQDVRLEENKGRNINKTIKSKFRDT